MTDLSTHQAWRSPRAKCLSGLALCVCIGLVLALFWPHVCHATDYLKGAETDVNDSFGASSEFKYFILLLEFFGCVWAWHKTKNPGVLTGIIILIIFFNFGFTHLVKAPT